MRLLHERGSSGDQRCRKAGSRRRCVSIYAVDVSKEIVALSGHIDVLPYGHQVRLQSVIASCGAQRRETGELIESSGRLLKGRAIDVDGVARIRINKRLKRHAVVVGNHDGWNKCGPYVG